MLQSLFRRESGHQNELSLSDIQKSSKVKKCINDNFDSMFDMVEGLKNAMDSGNKDTVHTALNEIIKNLLYYRQTHDFVNMDPKDKEKRQLFVSLGGLHQLLR